MEYKECGPACPPTCVNPDAPNTCDEPCVEGCHCEEGLLWTPGGCLTRDQCGCTRDGVYYRVNMIVVSCSHDSTHCEYTGI